MEGMHTGSHMLRGHVSTVAKLNTRQWQQHQQQRQQRASDDNANIAYYFDLIHCTGGLKMHIRCFLLDSTLALFHVAQMRSQHPTKNPGDGVQHGFIVATVAAARANFHLMCNFIKKKYQFKRSSAYFLCITRFAECWPQGNWACNIHFEK